LEDKRRWEDDIKMDLTAYSIGVSRSALVSSRSGFPMTGFCEYMNERSDSLKDGGSFEQLTVSFARKTLLCETGYTYKRKTGYLHRKTAEGYQVPF
jgi:hypothetical protein